MRRYRTHGVMVISYEVLDFEIKKMLDDMFGFP